MRIRKKKWAEPELAVCDFFVKNPEEHAGKWNETFNNGLPLYLEIGCGKGGFAGQFAVKNQDKNIIAVDIKIDMLGVGRRNIVEIFKNEGKTDADITNLWLVNYNVEQIDKIITKDDKIKRMPHPATRGLVRSITREDLHFPRNLKCTKIFLMKMPKFDLRPTTMHFLRTVLNILSRAVTKSFTKHTTCTTAMLQTILKLSTKKCFLPRV